MTLTLSKQFVPIFKKLQLSLPQSLLLTGPSGVGLHTIAKELARQATAIHLLAPTRLTKASTTSQISIDTIRDLYEKVRTSTDRVVIIDDADMMTVPAQNALLKLLEEPNHATKFILTSHHPELLQPTIRSRVVTHHVPLSEDSYDSDLFSKQTDVRKRQLMFIAQGRPAEMHRLLSDEHYFQQVADEIGFARDLVSMTAYETVSNILSSKYDRETVLRILSHAINLLERAATEQSVKKIDALLNAYSSIQRGGNIKLQLTRAML